MTGVDCSRGESVSRKIARELGGAFVFVTQMYAWSLNKGKIWAFFNEKLGNSVFEHFQSLTKPVVIVLSEPKFE